MAEIRRNLDRFLEHCRLQRSHQATGFRVERRRRRCMSHSASINRRRSTRRSRQPRTPLPGSRPGGPASGNDSKGSRSVASPPPAAGASWAADANSPAHASAHPRVQAFDTLLFRSVHKVLPVLRQGRVDGLAIQPFDDDCMLSYRLNFDRFTCWQRRTCWANGRVASRVRRVERSIDRVELSRHKDSEPTLRP